MSNSRVSENQIWCRQSSNWEVEFINKRKLNFQGVCSGAISEYVVINKVSVKLCPVFLVSPKRCFVLGLHSQMDSYQLNQTSCCHADVLHVSSLVSNRQTAIVANDSDSVVTIMTVTLRPVNMVCRDCNVGPVLFPNSLNMSGRGEEPPGMSEKMDLSAEDKEKRLPETTPLTEPPAAAEPLLTEVTPEYLYAHADELVNIIQLKARLAADWIRPVACNGNPELSAHYEQAFTATSDEMFARCRKLNMTPNQVPATVNDLKDKVQHIIDANSPAAQSANNKQQAQPAPSVQQNQTVPPRKGGGKRHMDSEGFTIPPKHLIRRVTPTLPSTSTTDSLPAGSNTHFSNLSSTNTMDVADDPIPEQPRKFRVPPFFVRPCANWVANNAIYKRAAPSMKSVQSRDNFLKLTVDSEDDHMRLKAALVKQGAEFKCIQRASVTQPQPSKRVTTELSYAQIVNNKPAAQPRTVCLRTPPPMGVANNQSAILSDSALELFRLLSKFAHDDTLHFPALLRAIRSALPTLRALEEDEEKALVIFEHYHAQYHGF
ncbi:hypothetical protein CDAR_64231 [Caerostris darwini]|uniref:Uncharacterized protein n=1 Tax=Caerostris darwini TaxID=1538125 RepID=A0AAV4QL70_9ARAC|nr:hypothetical protein CDAR_64231 [Caerostris darwini]